MTESKRIRVIFQENGEESRGSLLIRYVDSYEKIDVNTVAVDGVFITIDEPIIDIQDV